MSGISGGAAGLTVVGMGESGCVGLSSLGFNAIASADVLVGAKRFLDFFPDFRGQRLVMGQGKIGDGPGDDGYKLKDILVQLTDLVPARRVVVLASGDPMFYGIGPLLAAKFPDVVVIPQASSVQWALARLGWKMEQTEVWSFHGRPVVDWFRKLQGATQVAVLTDDESSPQRLAALMLEGNESEWDCWVGESLGGVDERLRRFSVDELAQCKDVGPLNILLLKRRGADWQPPPVLPFLAEDRFAKRVPKLGLITKREVRAISLAALQLRPGSVLWDIGAGSGSVSIEAALMVKDLRVCAIECDEECVRMVESNAIQFGLDLQGSYRVVAGVAPDALADLPKPDAVFIGGSKGRLGAIMARALTEMTPGGRMVVNAITLENVHEAHQGFLDLGLMPELSVVNISRGVPLAGKYLRYEALNPVHIFWAEKPRQGAAK